MAELVTRLKLDDKQFNDNIRKSKQQIQQFQASAKAVGTALKTFAVALIGIETAAQAFNKVIRGSQGISDEYDKVMRAATTTVDNFFASLTTGDFSVFDRGISNIIAKAREAQAALDQLGNTTMSYNYFNAKNQASFQDALARARDESLSQAERDAARKELEAIIADQKEITDTYKFRTIDAMKKMIAERNGLNPNDIDFIQIEDVFRIDASMMSDTIKADLNASYQEYLKIKEQVRKKYETKTVTDVDMFGNIITKKEIGNVAAFNAEMQKLNITYSDAMVYDTLLLKYGDKRLQDLMNMGTAASNAERNLASMEKSFIRINNTAIKGGNSKTTSTVSVKAEFEPGSLGYLEQQIKDFKLKFQYATDINSRNKIQKEIDELTKQKRYIELEYTLTQPLQEQKVSLTSLGNNKDYKKIDVKSQTNATKEGISINEQYVNSINSVSNALSALNSIQADNAASMLSWAGSVMTAVALAIQEIKKLIAAKTAEGAASAGAEAAKTPFIGWLLVGGAIATALAAFASIPSFNDGGIFQSPFTSGDKNLARLNGR